MIDKRSAIVHVTSTGNRSRRRHGDEAGLGGNRGAAYPGRALAQGQSGASRSGATAGCVATGGQCVGAPTQRGQWCGRQAQSQGFGSTTPAGRGAVRRTLGAAAQGRVGGGLPERAVDSQASASRSQTRVWRGVQQYRMLGAAAQPGLLAAEAGEACAAARRGGDRDLEAQNVAGAKKSPAARGERSSSSTSPDSRRSVR